MTKPNMIVFRVPDDDDEKRFLEVVINPDGTLSNHAFAFGVNPGDSYEELTFGEIILAQSMDGGSLELARIPIVNSQTLEPAVLHEIMEDIQMIVDHLVHEYTNRPTLQ